MYFKNTLLKDRIKDNQNMDMDSLAANQAMVLASYVPLLKPATQVLPGEALKVCIQKYTSMFESNAVRSNMASAVGTNDIRAIRAKTSNRSKKEMFGTFQFSVGKPGHLKIRCTTPSVPKKDWPLGVLKDKQVVPGNKSVTFRDDQNKGDHNPAPYRVPGQNDLAKSDKNPPAALPQQNDNDGTPKARKRKGGGRNGGKWKKPCTKTGVAEDLGKLGKEEGPAKNNQHTMDTGNKRKKKASKHTKARRTSSNPAPLNNLMSSFIPGSEE